MILNKFEGLLKNKLIVCENVYKYFVVLLFAFTILIHNENVHSADYSAPVILLPFIKPLYEDANSYSFIARVTDDNGVEEVKLHYRVIGSQDEFSVLVLKVTDDPDIYKINVSKEFILKPGMEYYIEARDVANNVSQEPFANLPRKILFSPDPKSKIVQSQSTNWWWLAFAVVATGAIAADINRDEGDQPTEKGTATLIIDSPHPDPNN